MVPLNVVKEHKFNKKRILPSGLGLMNLWKKMFTTIPDLRYDPTYNEKSLKLVSKTKPQQADKKFDQIYRIYLVS